MCTRTCVTNSLSVIISWALLEVRGNSSAADDEMAYAAGYAEGLLTAELIYMSYMNSFKNKVYCGQQSQYCDRLRDFLAKNQQYMAQEIARNPESQFWHQVQCAHCTTSHDMIVLTH